jgi:hypothetical protein
MQVINCQKETITMGTDSTTAMGKVISVDNAQVRQHLDRIVKGVTGNVKMTHLGN